uniref:Photosystem I reaction center subunit II, chloroplastic n=1 Tax=Oryza meridionalis TaxID=40149 RepID=A0A0E0E006_9ORYZ
MPTSSSSRAPTSLRAAVEEPAAAAAAPMTEEKKVFEMPTGGAAIMREGPSLLKLARKEQCLALGTRLRSKTTPRTASTRRRQGVGQNFRSIGKNVSPIEVKFTGKNLPKQSEVRNMYVYVLKFTGKNVFDI